MFTTLITNLATLIVTVRRNVLSSVMTTLMIIVIIVTYSARGNFATWLEQNPSPEQKVERIERGQESDKKIDNALRRDLVAIDADRILVRRFFDLTDPKSGLPVPYAATTHIVVGAGIAVPSAQMANIPRSYLSDLTNKIFRDPKNPVCVHLLTTEVTDEFYRRTLTDYGVHDVYSCPIADIDGIPVGIINANYINGKLRPADSVVYAILTSTSIRIAGYLAEVTAPEKTVWYRKLLNQVQ